jgi:CRISPR-associated protein Cas5d
VNTRARTFTVRVRGKLACFTRPEMKVERVSYEVMTPSAARGVLEAVFWKPGFAWCIDEIHVGAPVRWMAVRRNEVNGRASNRTYFADEDRAQRNTVALRDVDYLVSAHIEMTERAGLDDNQDKFESIFQRRLDGGQCFHQPYLGCREFDADVSFNVKGFEPLDAAVKRPLGMMLFDIHYGEPRVPLFFDAMLEGGVVKVPPRAKVLAASGVQQ